MPIFFYQSNNSNASTDRGVKASNGQRFMVDTHNQQAANQAPWKLVLPAAQPGTPVTTPVHGPAQLMASAPQGFVQRGAMSEGQFTHQLQQKIADNHGQMYRAFGSPCDLYVVGEMDASHPDWQALGGQVGNVISAVSSGRACNSFSAFASLPGTYVEIGSGMGWVGYRVQNVNVVFVHVPNKFATKEAEVTTFYRAINAQFRHYKGQDLGDIDLVMGDTNQQNSSFTAKCVGAALNKTFLTVHSQGDVNPADAHQRAFGGTNSNASRMYDTAVYNTTTARSVKYIYVSQAGATAVGDQAAAVTDHMGLGVDFVKS